MLRNQGESVFTTDSPSFVVSDDARAQADATTALQAAAHDAIEAKRDGHDIGSKP